MHSETKPNNVLIVYNVYVICNLIGLIRIDRAIYASNTGREVSLLTKYYFIIVFVQ